ncbi:MAG: pyridoxal-phosphate dependent enzyme, partial [Patescibacteria group bacterium]
MPLVEDGNIDNFIPKNTPIVSLDGLFGVARLYMKDESKNPTNTFKDRLAFEMIRPTVEKFKSGVVPEKITFGSISYGNTAKAMGYFSRLVNKIIGEDIIKSVAFTPPSLSERTFGPNVRGQTVSAVSVIGNIKKDCIVTPIDLKEKIYRSKDLEDLARSRDLVQGEFVDITEGLDRPAYVNIIIEAIEQQLESVPDYVIVPFGAGILCNEIIDYIADKKLHTKVIP